jgi:cob(I)alamin adenosyltransferase
VRLTKIYTRGGDAGETSLGDGARVSKLDARIAAFGTADEVNAALGVVLAGDCPDDVREVLERVQNELFDVGADLSVPMEREARLRVTPQQVDALERDCDRFNEKLPELKSFVLPGGSETAAQLHVARAACRRAEREAIAAAGTVDVNPLVLIYLNRLSDLLFILARAANAAAGRDEPLWRPGSSS